MSKSARIAVGLVLGFVIMFGVVYFASGPSARPGEYISREHNFGLIGPKEWDQIEDLMGTAIVFRRSVPADGSVFAENINVVVESLPAEMTLDQYTELSKKNLAMLMTDWVLLDSSDYTLAGQRGRCLEHTCRMGQMELHQKQAFIVAGRKAYVLTATAAPNTFEEYEDIFEECFLTFRTF